MATGSTYDAVTAEDVAALRIPALSQAQQRAIAGFLDAETARIDALIAKKLRMVDLVSERFRAEVEARTDDGIPVRVRHLTSVITSGPRGWSELASDSGKPFVRSANLMRSSIGLRLDDLARVDPPAASAAEAARCRVREADVLVGITGANTGWVGIAGSQVAGGYISQHVALLRPSGVLAEWLGYALFSHRVQGMLLGSQYGGTKQQLGLTELAEVIIRVPAEEAQRAHIAALVLARERAERVTVRLSAQLALLQERRQALIAAAVTGELDIPGTAA